MDSPVHGEYENYCLMVAQQIFHELRALVYDAVVVFKLKQPCMDECTRKALYLNGSITSW